MPLHLHVNQKFDYDERILYPILIYIDCLFLWQFLGINQNCTVKIVYSLEYVYIVQQNHKVIYNIRQQLKRLLCII